MNYYNDFNQHKKSDTVKWVVAFFLIAVLLFGVAASLFLQLRPNEETHVPETENEVVVPEGTVTDENGTELESGTVYKLSSRMLFSSPSVRSTTAPEGVTVQATVLPEEAANKLVDWSIAFVNPDSAWATGKTVTDYVTVTPESDGSTIATITCLADFGEQIKITVSSRDNPYAKAECSVDYLKRLTSNTINFFGVDIANGGSGILSSTSTATLNPTAKFTYSDYTTDITYSVPVHMSYFNGTIESGSVESMFESYITSVDAYNALSENDQDIVIEYFNQGKWEYAGTSSNRYKTSITFADVFQDFYDYMMGVLPHLSGGENSAFANTYKSEFFRMLSSERYSAIKITCETNGDKADGSTAFFEDFEGYITISNEVISVTLDNTALEF